MSISFMGIALVGVLGALQPSDLGPLDPAVQWLQTERLRANLRHRPNIEPFADELLSAPGGPSASVALRGRHLLLMQLKRGESASVRIAALEGHEIFPETIWALFAPGGEMGPVGRVAPGKADVVRVRARQDGVYRLLINTGPASGNSCSVTLRARRWALEAAGWGKWIEQPLYYHSVRDFALAGLNLDMLDFEGLRQEFVTEEGLKKWTAAVARWGDYARRFKLRLMPAVDLGGTEWEVQAWKGCRPGLYIKHYEKYPLAPCPLDRRWWEQVVLRRARAVARLSRDNPYIVGFGIDPEMYRCWHYGHYMLSGTCFCDHCLGGFLRKQGKDLSVLAQLKTGAERHDWLVKQGLMKDYDKYLEDETYKIACWMREDLHRTNPHFLTCVYVLEIGNWFCRGLARGLGTPQVPVIDYAEATYFSGWGKRPQKDMANFRDWGAPVAYGGTLWYGGYPPAEPHALPAQMYNFAMQAAGYWIWPGQDLHRDPGRLPVHRGVLATLPDYWRAMVLANREIVRKMAGPEGYQSPLSIIKPGLVWSSRAKPEQGFEWKHLTYLPIHLARPATLYFNVPRRMAKVSVVVQAPGEGNGASVALVGPDGKTRTSARGELDEPVRLEAPSEGGVWSVVVEKADGPLADVGLRLEGLPPYLATGPRCVLRPPEKEGPLLAYWPLDEGKGTVAHDTSGKPAFDGTVGNCAWAKGKRGQCLEFIGKGSHVRVPHSWALDGLREFTLAAWVKLRAMPEPGHGGTLINKGPEAPVQHVWWWIGYPPHYRLVLEMGNEKHKYGTSFASQPLKWELGRWYHVAVTYRWDSKQATARLYRDGQLIGESTKDEELHTGNYDVLLGAYAPSGFHGLQGWLDDVRIYDRALPEDEVKALAQGH